MEEETKLAKAHPKTKSLRTTVPFNIVNIFKLKAGSSLIWEIKAVRSEFVVVVKPKR